MEQVIPALRNLDDSALFFINLASLIILGLLGTQIVVLLVKHALIKSKYADAVTHKFITNAVKVICLALVLAMVLDKFGVSKSTIVAVLGAAGAAIALALKDSLSNIAGGIMIIVTQPFKRGDMISIGEYRGKVLEIDLFLTTMRTPDFRTITVPNGLINTSVLVNESSQEIRRVDCEFYISYDSDIAKAKEILYNVCVSGPLIIMDPAPEIGAKAHSDSSITLALLAWCKTENYYDARYYLQESVKYAFDEAGIEIPYPHVDVVMK